MYTYIDTYCEGEIKDFSKGGEPKKGVLFEKGDKYPLQTMSSANLRTFRTKPVDLYRVEEE